MKIKTFNYPFDSNNLGVAEIIEKISPHKNIFYIVNRKLWLMYIVH